MCDEKERSAKEAVEGAGNATSSGCCGRKAGMAQMTEMAERMFVAFRGTAEDSSAGEPGEGAGSGSPASCGAVMRRMKSLCCDSTPEEGAAEE